MSVGLRVILDRDGVLNPMVINADHGTIDSPLHPDQVEIFPWVPECLRRLNTAGFSLVIATNQPSAAKGKTTKQNLHETHRRIVELAQADGGVIERSHICYHRSEDGCSCRKPRPGMLLQALREVPKHLHSNCWMVGDGVTDVQAGVAAGVRAAYLGPQKCDACKIFDQLKLRPSFWGQDLSAFTDFLTA